MLDHYTLSTFIHFFVVVPVFAADYLFPPVTVVKIPFYRFFDSVGEFGFGQPAEFVVDLRGVDGIAHIVSFSVGNERDKTFGFAEFFISRLTDYGIHVYRINCLAVGMSFKTLRIARNFFGGFFCLERDGGLQFSRSCDAVSFFKATLVTNAIFYIF